MMSSILNHNVVNVGILGTGIDEWDTNVISNLQNSSNILISGKPTTIRVLFCANASTVHSIFHRFPEVDVYFVFGKFLDPIPELGDFLLEKLQNGKGLVLAGNCLSETLDFEFFKMAGICGGIEDELPCTKGIRRPRLDQFPEFMEKISKHHPILNEVEIFDGGIDPDNYAIQVLEPCNKIDEDITLVACWKDSDHTPLIIAKDYNGTKSEFGRIVVLNFWPVSKSWPHPESCWNNATH